MMEAYEIVLRAEFSAAHRLKLHDGSFEPLHGHNWRVEVFLRGSRLDSAGLLADFTVIEPRLQAITRDLHDTYLNENPAFAEWNPSTERVARLIHDRLAPSMPEGVAITGVRVWETSTCAAGYLPQTESAASDSLRERR